MGKHDKAYGYEAARVEELERRLKFAEENNRKLMGEVAAYQKYLANSKMRIERVMAEKDAKIAKLEATIVRLAVK